MIGFRGWKVIVPFARVVKERVYSSGQTFIPNDSGGEVVELNMRDRFPVEEFITHDERASLGSITGRNQHWKESYMEAKCKIWPRDTKHVSPVFDCTCGLYSFYNYDQANRELVFQEVVGVVQGWGRLIFHETGFRAQYLGILGFLPSVHGEKIDKAISKRYKIPILTLEQALWIQKEFSPDYNSVIKKAFEVDNA